MGRWAGGWVAAQKCIPEMTCGNPEEEKTYLIVEGGKRSLVCWLAGQLTAQSLFNRPFD